MDFILATKPLQDPHNGVMIFKDQEKQKEYIIRTKNGDGHLGEPLGTYTDNPDNRVIIPVSVTRNQSNSSLNYILIGYDWSFEPGELQLLWAKLDEKTAMDNGNKVLQPATNLVST